MEKEVGRNSFVASVNTEHRFSAYDVDFSLGGATGSFNFLTTGYWQMCLCMSKIGNIGHCLFKCYI